MAAGRLARVAIGLSATAALVGALLWWHPSALYLWAKAFHIIVTQAAS